MNLLKFSVVKKPFAMILDPSNYLNSGMRFFVSLKIKMKMKITVLLIFDVNSFRLIYSSRRCKIFLHRICKATRFVHNNVIHTDLSIRSISQETKKIAQHFHRDRITDTQRYLSAYKILPSYQICFAASSKKKRTP